MEKDEGFNTDVLIHKGYHQT